VSQVAEPDGPSSQSSSIPGSPFGAWVTKSPQNVKVHGPLLFAGSELLVHSLSATSPPLSHSSSPSTTLSPQTGPAYALNDSPADKNRGNSKDRDLRFDMVRFLKLVICVLMFEIIDISFINSLIPGPDCQFFKGKFFSIRPDPGKFPALTGGPVENLAS
jgi:hypothetical protein